MTNKIKWIVSTIGSVLVLSGLITGVVIVLNQNDDKTNKKDKNDDEKDKPKIVEEQEKFPINLNNIGVIDDFEPIELENKMGLWKYKKFIDKIYSLSIEKNENKIFSKLNLSKFRTAIKRIFGTTKAGNMTKTADLVAKIINKNDQKKFVVNLGNKNGELDTLVIELKKLTKKPTYVEFIKLFKNKSNGISYRKRLNTVMHFLLGYNYKFRLKPNLKYTITTNDEHILSNEEAQTKYNEFMTELERRMGSTQYVNISLEHLIESIKTIFQSNKNPSRILFSKDIIIPNVEGTNSDNVVKKYGLFGIDSYTPRGKGVYINSLGDKFNDLTDWIVKVKSIAWKSRPSFKDFVNSFPHRKNLKLIKNRFVKVWKIAFGENKDAINFLNEGMHGKLIGSTTIDVDLENQIVDHSQSIATIAPSLSYSPILEDHTTLSVQKNNPKIGYWNLKDYKIKGFSNEVFDKKTSMLAKILIETNASIMGLSQIKGQRAVEKLVNKLNELDSTSSWKFIRSGYAAYDSQKVLVSSSPDDAEFYGFIYKGNEFTIKPFEINKNDEITQYYGKIYENPKLINEFSDNKRTAFIRPPFGVQFVNKDGKDFTAVIGHHDSFGVESGPKTKGGNIEEAIPANSGTFPNQGTQEVWESLHLIDVMKYFDIIDGENGDLVYMGNTNIKYDMTQINGQGRPSIFKPLIDEGFKPLVNPLDSNHKTSLGEVDYENSFDRIFVKSSMLPKNQGDSNWHNKFEKYNLGEIFTRSLNPLDPNTYIDSQDLATKKIDSSYWDSTQDKPKMKFIKELVSGNAPIYAEWDLSQSEIESSSPNWDTYLNSRKINKLKIPEIEKNPQELIDEVYEKINNKQTPVTLPSDDYDISKEEVKNEILTEIVNIFGLNNIQKGYLAITTNLGILVEETYTTISITASSNEAQRSRIITFKIKKGNPNDRWKNILTFSTWKNLIKNNVINIVKNENERYSKFVDVMVKFGVSPSTRRTTTYPKGKIFGLSKPAMENILYSLQVESVNTWEDYLTSLQSIPNTHWGSNNDINSASSSRRRILKKLTQLLSDVDDLT